jgi:2,3-bisphosphoglycerate-dependent phosphoglycerate mutase
MEESVAMRLYFVRHGESEANLLGEFSNSGLKHPLTARGLTQAQRVADDLAGLTVAQVYSSPVLRAQQTARIIAESLVAPLEITEALREWDVGIYEGTRDPEGWKLHRQVQEDWFCDGHLESKMPGGESFLEIQARFVPFIQGLLQSENAGSRQVVLVGHGGVYLAMLPVVLKNIDVAFALQHGIGYTGCVIAEARLDGLSCLSWGGTPVEDA